MRRPQEDGSSGSDAEEDIDVGLESVYPGRVSDLSSGPPPAQTERSRRRGVIEKRRRDRINQSLSELRRLVPTAAEKQGSVKLEKAEILQMTVEHLKVLQAAAGSLDIPSLVLDVPSLALDFLSLGFRECLAEVSRYLSAVEGLDARDPLQARLLSHLTSVTLTMNPHRLHQSPPPTFAPHYWTAAFVPHPYGLNVFPPPPEVGGAPQRMVEMLQRGSALFSSSPPLTHAPSTSILPPSISTSPPIFSSTSPPIFSSTSPPIISTSPPISISTSPPIISTSPPISPTSTSRPHRPWGTEDGAF